MHMLSRTLTCLLLGAGLAGCGLVYQPALTQGNLLSKKTVDQLKPGMTKSQVVALMGTPSISSPFDHNRWDYVYAYAIDGGKMNIHKFTLFFDNDTLTRTEGSLFSANNKKMLQQAKMYNKAGVGNAKGDKDNGDDNGDGGDNGGDGGNG